MKNLKPPKERGLRELVFYVPPMVYVYRLSVDGFKLARAISGAFYAPMSLEDNTWLNTNHVGNERKLL